MKDTRISSSFLYIFTVSRETEQRLCHPIYISFIVSRETLYMQSIRIPYYTFL